MTFKEFAEKLSACLSGGASTDKFARTLFESIVTDDGLDIIDGYQPSSFKSFYNGHSTITGIAKKINAYLEPENFSCYILDFKEPTLENLCNEFRKDLPGISTEDIGDRLAELFVNIITEAAGAKKKSTPKGTSKGNQAGTGKSTDLSELYALKDETYITEIKDDFVEIYRDYRNFKSLISPNPFKKYLIGASSYYSTKKTLLYAENPHPFYELYVCNDINTRSTPKHGFLVYKKDQETIQDATVEKLTNKSNYIIIQGTGGIGKTMLLTHLFLSSSKAASKTNVTPFLLQLKDYKERPNGFIHFIADAVKEYDPQMSVQNVVNKMRSGKNILLLDGLDEIPSSLRENFDNSLEAFIKAYPDNSIIITSRPVYSFVSYSKFSLFEIQPLSKQQSIELIQKLDFWDIESKNKFLNALNRHLYVSHREFASNPLLLTIMLMTYSSFGEIPSKMHVFYAKAYETMARLHDATKGSYKRPLHTGLTPEEFSKLFSQFCARTYMAEILEFNILQFSSYMDKVLKSASDRYRSIPPRDFLLDLTDNLCIMYKEGEVYYFIHRSFQEYFAAVYFASEYDDKLKRVGDFFEKSQSRSYTDKTFDMLYDMIPEKVERFIFLPYLENLIETCKNAGNDEYWEFLTQIYPYLYITEGNAAETFEGDIPFMYSFIDSVIPYDGNFEPEDYKWPPEINLFPRRYVVEAHSYFLDPSAFNEYPDPELIPDALLETIDAVYEDELPSKYFDYFGHPEHLGTTIELDIYELRKHPQRYSSIIQNMERPDFPLRCEYDDIKEYYKELKEKVQRKTASDNIFDD